MAGAAGPKAEMMMRRGSLDDAAVSLRPNFRNLAQRRRSAPSLVFGKTLGMPWSPIREESCWASPEQSPFVLGLTAENGPLMLEQSLQVTEGSKTRDRHLFLFRDVLVIAKLKSSSCYRLKHRLDLHESWVLAFDPELEEQVPDSDLDLGLSLLLDPHLCLLTFSSPEPKERWLHFLQRNICEARARSGAEWAPSEGLMKVLTGNASVKSLSGGGMDHLIELPINFQGTDVKPVLTAEEKLSESRWRAVVRRLRSGSSFIHRKKLFGKTLSKVCTEGGLPKAIQEILLLLRHRGPSTEGVFRKSCNSKKMQEVRDQLETGAEVLLEELPVVLLVGLLKSFLKELPESLLDSQLYPQWMNAFNQEDPEQRAEQLQRVVSELPGPNLLLLQHLLCILHHIHQNSESTRMPSHNLAVCIGPTLLWSNSTALDQQAHQMKEVSDLTEFLIEHWEIIGDNIPNLLDTDKDSVSSQLHDSAYDSTDPDGDQEPSHSCPGATASVLRSPSLPRASSSAPSIPRASSSSTSFLRRRSEPSLSPSTELPSPPRYAWSRDDCSSSSFGSSHKGELRPCSSSCSSSSSLDSTASNQSEGSVFGGSPAGSPTCARRESCVQRPERETIETPERETPERETRETPERKTRETPERETRETRETSERETRETRETPARKTRERPERETSERETRERPERETRRASTYLSSEEPPRGAVGLSRRSSVDLLGWGGAAAPPSYQQAVQKMGRPPSYSSMTVQDAIRLERQARLERQVRPQSGHWPLPAAVSADRRPRAMSESVSERRKDMVLHKKDMVSHREDMVSHREDMVSHKKDMVLHKKDMVPHRKDKVSHREDMVSHREDMVPHREDMVLHKEDIVSHREDMMSHSEDMVPHREDMVPHREDMVLHREDMVLHKEDMVSHKEDIVSHSENMVSHREDRVPHRCSPPQFEEFSYAQESYV